MSSDNPGISLVGLLLWPSIVWGAVQAYTCGAWLACGLLVLFAVMLPLVTVEGGP